MEPLTAVTYNVRHAILDDGRDAWDRRRAGVVDRLRADDPDLIGLQECAGDQHADVAADLPEYEWVGVAGTPGSGEHNPIGYGPRLSLVDSGTSWLSESGDPGSVGWDAEYARVLTVAHLRDRETGREFTAYNAHLDHIGSRARLESVALLRERIDALPAGRPVVVTGDFNTGPGQDAYERILNAEFRRPLADARRVADRVDGPETTLSDFEALRPDRRVDHVFVTPEFAVERYAVDATTVEGRYPSDHLPVVADLVYRSGSRAEPGE